MSCCICSADTVRPFLDRNGYHIVRCERCGFLYVHPRPSQEELQAFYQDPSYFQGESVYGYDSYIGHRSEIERVANERLTTIERFISPGCLLDVGCASGYFLFVARQRGWHIEGVEIAEAMARAAEELLHQPIHSTLDAIPFPPQSFDVITLWEYIEHVPDPRADLLRVHELLKPGGLLALSTPNAGQRVVTKAPTRWREFKPPEHLSFFTRHTLERLVRACGFQPVLVRAIVPHLSLPVTIERGIEICRETLGDRHTRRTPFWWIYSLTRRMVSLPFRVYQKLILSPFDYSQGIELYARRGAEQERVT